jgi:DNA-binding beta-propeller fold protein YncE
VTGNTDIDGRGQLALLDLRKQAIVKLIQFSQNEFIGPVVFSPDGSLAYVVSNQRNPGQVQVKVFDLVSKQIANTFSAGDGIGKAIAITPDGSELEVGNYANATVVAMDVHSDAVSGTSAVLGAVFSITVSADGQ